MLVRVQREGDADNRDALRLLLWKPARRSRIKQLQVSPSQINPRHTQGTLKSLCQRHCPFTLAGGSIPTDEGQDPPMCPPTDEQIKKMYTNKCKTAVRTQWGFIQPQRVMRLHRLPESRCNLRLYQGRQVRLQRTNDMLIH